MKERLCTRAHPSPSLSPPRVNRDDASTSASIRIRETFLFLMLALVLSLPRFTRTFSRARARARARACAGTGTGTVLVLVLASYVGTSFDARTVGLFIFHSVQQTHINSCLHGKFVRGDYLCTWVYICDYCLVSECLVFP